MKPNKFFLAFLAAALLTACSTNLVIDSVPVAEQKEIYRDGVESLLSEQKSTVILRPVGNMTVAGERGNFILSVKNGENKSFEIDTTNVRAYLDGEQLEVFTYDQLQREMEIAQTWAAIAVGLAAAANSYSAASAGHTYNTGTYTGTDSYGTNSYGTYSGYSYDAAAAQQAQAAANAENSANFARLSAEAERAQAELDSTILRKTTVLPGEWAGGYLMIDEIGKPEESAELRVYVDAGSETHEFIFTYRIAR